MQLRSFVGMVIGGVSALALSMVATGGPSVREARAESLVTAEMESFGPENCTYHCRSCGYNLHDIVVHYDSSENRSNSSHLETCNAGSCSLHACGSSALASRVQRLWNDAQEMAPEQLLAFLVANSDVAYYNAERHAIQFHCVEGKVVASLPVGGEAIPVLAGAGGQLPLLANIPSPGLTAE